MQQFLEALKRDNIANSIGVHMIARLFFGALGLILLARAEATAAELPGPPPPPRYQIVLRYRIAAARDQHVVQYDALIAHLKALDFEFDSPLDKNPETDREDRSKNTLRGTVPSDQVLKILRNPNVASVLVLPVEFEYPPKDLDAVVRIHLELAGGFGVERQRELAEQVKAILHALNFREVPSYDHHGHSGRPFTRIAGTIPQGRLEVLLKDLRGQPAGWFAPRLAPGDLPTPLRNVNPVQLIEVERDSEPIVQVPVPKERSPEFLEKISSDLWALVGEKGQDNETVRVELVFAGTLAAEGRWQNLLKEAVPTLFVEGQVGQVVSVIVNHAQVRTLAVLPGISTIRLPRLARVDVEPTAVLPGNNAKALAKSGLEELHRKGFRGQDVRLAVIDTDFRGWSELLKQGKLPPSTRLVDLTAERDPEILPAPVVYPRGTGPSDLEVLPASAAKQVGHGTQCALAATLAVPQVSLVLVRIDGSSPYELDELARYFRGGSLLSPYIDRRRDELVTARAELNLLRFHVLFERRLILESFTDERDLEKDFGFLGPVYGWVFSQRTWIRDQVAYVDKLEKALTQRNRRFFDLVEDIRSLAGITLVSNPLVWNEGYAVGAASPLSRALERQLATAPVRPGAKAAPLLWFQSAGNTRGQTWTGLFHDDDSNGLMEFAPAQQKLKPGAWTTELNFLAWKPFAKDEVAELPEGARLRIALQWREPHDPDYYLRAGDEDDLYRKPLAELRVRASASARPLLQDAPRRCNGAGRCEFRHPRASRASTQRLHLPGRARNHSREGRPLCPPSGAPARLPVVPGR